MKGSAFASSEYRGGMNGGAISQTKGALKAILELNGEPATFGRVSHSALPLLARPVYFLITHNSTANFILPFTVKIILYTIYICH